MPAKKNPTKFFLFTRTDPDTNKIIEFIVAENLIQVVKFNGINSVEIFLKGGDKLNYVEDARSIFERLKQELAPSKIK